MEINTIANITANIDGEYKRRLEGERYETVVPYRSAGSRMYSSCGDFVQWEKIILHR